MDPTENTNPIGTQSKRRKTKARRIKGEVKKIKGIREEGKEIALRAKLDNDDGDDDNTNTRVCLASTY